MQRSAMLVAFLLAAVLASRVNGQTTCPEFTTEQTCYDNRVSLSCVWNPSTSSCSANSTPTCADLYRDTVGCAARTDCAINNNNNVCYSFPKCSSLTLEPECSKLPSTCAWDGASCLNSWTGCATHSSDGFACESNACAYDVFAPAALPKCIESFAESKSMYPDCSTWSNYPGLSAEEACVSHGCSFSSTTKLCKPLGSGGSADAPSASLDIKFEVGGFQQLPGTTEFDFVVIVPFAQFFDPSAPAWHAITIGTPPSKEPGVATQPSQCNSLLTAFPAFGTGQPVASTHTSYSTLTNYFVSKIDAASQTGYHRLDLFGEVTEDDIGVRQTVGNYKMAPGESVLRQATTVAPYTNVELHGRVDLDWAVANCGVIREVNDNDVTYYMPLTLEVRKGDSNAFSTLSPVIQYNTVSSVVFFASSADTVKIDIQQLRDVDGEFTLTNVRTHAATIEGEFVDVTIPACGAFETRRAWVVREAWKSNIADSIVGLRDLRDVSMVYNGGRDPSTVSSSNGDQIMGSPTNAFGTRPVAVSPPLSCPNSECITLIYFITDCNAYSYGVNTLNWASFQPVERQVLLMGGTLQSPVPWPGTDGLRTSLDNIHNFYHYPQKWSTQYETFPPVASPVGSDIDGVHPDPVLINIHLDTRVMDGIYEGNVHFQCGILREPENPTIEGNMIVLFSTNPLAPVEASAIAEAARSPHLADNGMLAVACAVEPAMRNSFTMIIDVLETTLTPYRMTPVDSRGVMATEPDGSPTTQSLTWWDLKTVSTYTPRQVEPLRLAPAAQGVPGVDVVGTLVYWLHKLLPSPGFQLDFSAKVVFPSTSVHDGSPNVYKVLSLTLTKSANTLSVASRTLLQTGGSSSSNSTDTPANSGTPSMFVGIPPNPNNTDWRSLQIIDLQNPSMKTKVETALTMTLALGLMTIIGSMAMIKLPISWTTSRVF